MTIDWRRLETEIVDIVERQGVRVERSKQADKMAYEEPVNLSILARELADVLERAK